MNGKRVADEIMKAHDMVWHYEQAWDRTADQREQLVDIMEVLRKASVDFTMIAAEIESHNDRLYEQAPRQAFKPSGFFWADVERRTRVKKLHRQLKKIDQQLAKLP